MAKDNGKDSGMAAVLTSMRDQLARVEGELAEVEKAEAQIEKLQAKIAHKAELIRSHAALKSSIARLSGEKRTRKPRAVEGEANSAESPQTESQS